MPTRLAFVLNVFLSICILYLFPILGFKLGGPVPDHCFSVTFSNFISSPILVYLY